MAGGIAAISLHRHIERSVLDTNPPQVEYRLSEMGRALLPVLDAFSEVSMKLRQQYDPA